MSASDPERTLGEACHMAKRPVRRWLLRWGSLALAVAPTLIVASMFLRAWILDDHASLDRRIWPVFVLQLCAIAVFCWHALGNKRLEEEVAGWIVRFLVLIPFGTLEYWCKYLWPSTSRP